MKNKILFIFAFIALAYTESSLNASEIENHDFFDISKVTPATRVPRSKIVQFCYTSELNIGDYLPTLGIRLMLGQNTDLWSMRDINIDFDFINKNYTCAIIGGAGLFHKGFEGFFKTLLAQCKIPMIVWGVGICLPNGKIKVNQGINKQIIGELEKRCDLINVRDDLSWQYYNLQKFTVSACPTAYYLQKFRHLIDTDSNRVLYASHDELVPESENTKIIATIQKNCSHFKIINNIFSKEKKISEIENIIKEYCKSSLVVTTRLHGAIIAYSLGIPYIIVPFDEKLRAFHKKFGNGAIANTMDELKHLLKDRSWISLKPVALAPVIAFGNQAKQWARKFTKAKPHPIVRALYALFNPDLSV